MTKIINMTNFNCKLHKLGLVIGLALPSVGTTMALTAKLTGLIFICKLLQDHGPHLKAAVLLMRCAED